MKYLKTYEFFNSYEEKENFWLICENEVYFLASLHHIKVLEEDIESFLRRREVILSFKFEPAFPIQNFPVETQNKKFYVTLSGYMPFSKGYDYYIKYGLKYMGEIIPTNEEIEDVEFKCNIKKYNL